MKRPSQKSPSRKRQLDRALTLLDRLITIIEQDGEEMPHRSAFNAADNVNLRSPYWRDDEVRQAIVGLYNANASVADATAILTAQFGADRAPGKSVLARIYLAITKARLEAQ